MALRISIEEERARQEQVTREAEPEISNPGNQNNFEQTNYMAEETPATEESLNTPDDDLLQQALAMSMTDSINGESHESPTYSQEDAKVSSDIMTDTQDIEMADEEDDAAMKLALQISMQSSNQSENDKKEEK